MKEVETAFELLDMAYTTSLISMKKVGVINEVYMNLIERDEQVIWHPFTPQKNMQHPVGITHAKDTLLYDDNGTYIQTAKPKDLILQEVQQIEMSGA